MNSTESGPEKSSEGGNILSGENPIKFNLADPLPLFIVQTIIILSLCHVINLGMHRLRQPKVVSEVLAGIILGPSILGQIPGFTKLIFPPESIPFLNLVANLGLVLFLFLVGLELDPKLIMKRAKHALGISVAGLVIPFAFSCGISVLLYKEYEKPATTGRPSPPFSEFLLTCGVAMSLTAFPVLARILAEMQLMSTTVGFITVCAAAAGDIVAWILLALLVSLINATTPIMPLYVVLMALFWCVFLIYAVRPLLMYLVRLTHSEEEPSQKMIAATLVIVLSSAFVTNIIGIHSIFGGFLVGLLIPHDSGFAEGLTRRIEDLVGVYFLPIFFACSGFKTQVSLLNNAETWGLVIMVTVISWFGKMLGCTTAAKYNGMTWRESFAIGFLMNCKGLVEYIILNIGHDTGVISDRVFVIMIAMCLILTMIATPFVGFLYPVWYQKELEVKREAERKALALRPKGADPDKKPSSRGGIFSGIKNKLRRRRGVRDESDKEELGASSTHGGERFEDLDSVRIHASVHEGDHSEDERAQITKKTVVKNSIMFCLDKTSNAPGVMTLLQLFAGSSTASLSHRRSKLQRAKGSDPSEKDDERYKGILQPSIDISDPQGRTFVKKRSNQDIKTQPKIYAIRLLHISERTSAAMLTASRCMDRLYKDTVMMMVMAFAKLNSVPLKPLVAISTDTAQSTVAQDILDRAMDLDVGWVVFPWNSSHLTDLPMPSTPVIQSGPGGPLFATGTSLQPGIAISMVNTNTSTQNISGTNTPAVNTTTQDAPNLQVGEPSELPRVFPYNISRYFDHEEAQKIASGGHVNLSQTSESHRTSIASNTKVLSKLIAATGNASQNVSTAVLVDRGLGLVGGVEHIVVPLLGGNDDYDTLCLASCLSRNTKCFVTVLRIASRQQQISHLHGSDPHLQQQQPYQFQSHLSPPPNVPLSHHGRQGSHEKSVPPSPDVIKSRFIGGAGSRSMSGHQHRASEERTEDLAHARSRASVNQVPKDDKELLKTFFGTKPQFQGHPSRGYRNPTSRSAQASNGGGVGTGTKQDEAVGTDGDSILGDDDDDDATQVEEGAMVLAFQEITDAIQWSRSYLTAQDLIVIGHDTPPELAPVLQNHHHQSLHHHTALSRVPSMDEGRAASPLDGGFAAGTRLTLSPTQVSHASPPSILERRGLTLSPRSDRLQPHTDYTTDSPLLRTSNEYERPARSEFAVHKGRSRNRSRSHGRSTRSIRSLSRGRKQPDTPTSAAGPSGATSGGGGDFFLAGVPLTTCQLILGLAADQLIQSGVFCSLLVVRSRWISPSLSSPNSSTSLLRHKGSSLSQVCDPYSPDSGSTASSALPTRTSGVSGAAAAAAAPVPTVPLVASGGMGNGRMAEQQQRLSVDDQTRQYHTQQRAHHSKLSQDLDSRVLATVLASPGVSNRPRQQEVGSMEKVGPVGGGGGQGRGHGYSASDMETPRASGENNV